jgi:ankyrin repeat protein
MSLQFSKPNAGHSSQRLQLPTIGRMWMCCMQCLLLLLLVSDANPVRAAEDKSPADLAEQQNWTALKQQVSTDATGINQPQADGMTALHWAVQYENTKIVQALLEAGSAPDLPTHYHITPLRIACVAGHDEIAEHLLLAGADPNHTLPGGETMLMTAARTGQPNIVDALLQRGADVNASDDQQQTAVMWAAAEGHVKVAQQLIDAGAEFRKTLSSGFSALTFAVREGKVDVVDLLLTAGADLQAPMEPKRGGGRAVRSGTSPLILAIENGHFELAAHLIRKGADPNDQRSGYAPLHVLTWVRKPNRGDGEDGDPAPLGSGRMTSLQLARFLVESGADVNVRLTKGNGGPGRLNPKGATPFLMAADTADVPYLRLLLELGADPTLRNIDEATPLMAAAGLGTMAPGEEAGTEDECLEAMQFLLDLGADINAVDNNGETVMHGAAYKGSEKLVRFVASHGAKVAIWNRHNRYGWTPLLIARGYRPGNFRPLAPVIEALREILLSAGIDPPMNDKPSVPQKDQYSKQK